MDPLLFNELILPAMALMAAGLIAGVTAGLFGVGGGFIVVPVLLAVLPLFSDHPEKHIHVAIGTSLASILVSSARSVQAHHRGGSVDFNLLRSWMPWLVVGVLLGTAVASTVDATVLALVFAGCVLLYSIYFIAPDKFTARNPHNMPAGAGKATLAFGLGGISALLGIGGGTPFVVTMMMCGRSLHQAIATAAGIGFIIALPGAIGFMIIGFTETGLPPGSVGYINVPALLAITVMSVFTAPLGARLAHSLDEAMLKRAFGMYLVLVSATMFYKVLTP